MEKAAFRIRWIRGGVDSPQAVAPLSSCLPSGAGKCYFIWRAEDKEDCLVAQKEPVLEPGDLCSALFYGKVTRPCVSVFLFKLCQLCF